MGAITQQSIKGTIANYLGVAIGFVTTFFVLTTYLTPEEVGLTRVLVDTATLFCSLALLGTNSSTLRFYPLFKDDSRNQQGLYFWTLIIPFVGFLLFLAAFFIFKELIVSTFSEKSPLFVHYVYYTLPVAFFLLYMTVFETNASLLTRVAVPRFIREVFIRVGLLAGYLLFGFHLINLDGLVIALCITYGLGALLNLFYLLFSQKISFKPNFQNITPALRRDFLLYTLFLLTSAIVSSVLPTLSSFFISAKMGLMFTGIYAIANYIAAVVEIPSRSLNALIQPQLAVALRATPPDVSTATKLCKKVSLNQLLIGTLILILIWINIDLFFSILPNGEQYALGKWVVLLLSLTKLITATTSVGCSPLNYSRWYYTALFFTLFYTTVSIVLNTYLIPIYGIEGGALATLLSCIAYNAVLLFYIGKRIGTNPFSKSQLYVLGIGCIMLAINYLIAFIFHLCFTTPSLLVQIMQAVVCTGAVGLTGLAIIYFGKVSPEVNALLTKCLIKCGLKK